MADAASRPLLVLTGLDTRVIRNPTHPPHRDRPRKEADNTLVETLGAAFGPWLIQSSL